MSKAIIPLLCLVMFFSCAKPTDPETLYVAGGYVVVAQLPLQGYGEDVEVRDTIAYVAQGEGGLAVVDITDRSRPRILSVCQQNVKGTSHKIALNGPAVYVAANTFGVNAIDVSDPCAPSATVWNMDMKPALWLHVFGNYLLAAIGENGVKVADVSDPVHPNPMAAWQTPGYAEGLATTPDSAYLLVASGEMGLTIFDVRDMQGGFGPYKQVGWTDTPGYAVAVTTMGSRPIAFVACGTAGVQVVDFSDTTSADSVSARVIGSYQTGGYAKEVAYQDGRLYVTTELRGLQVLSVENPAAPRLVGAIHTEYAMGLAVDQHYVYVADEVEGLVILSIPPY